ncbi:hypothetical protein Pelo_10196 [Pelomyxa schiedti]|nr:hypothetical protein Pelo_10196 [Pelomyxa schiedti]
MELKYFQSGVITIAEFPERNQKFSDLLPLPHLSFSELEQKAQDCYVEARLLSGIASHHLFGTRLSVSIQDIFGSKPVETIVREFADSIKLLVDMKNLKIKLSTITATIYDLCIHQLSVGDAVSEDIIQEIVRAEILVRCHAEIFSWCQGQVLPFTPNTIRCSEADKSAEAQWSRHRDSTPSDFGVESEFWLGPKTDGGITTTLKPFQAAIDTFKAIKTKACPTEKAACVTKTAHAMFKFVTQLWEGVEGPKKDAAVMSGDVTVSVFQYVVAHACVPFLFTELLIASELSSGPDASEHEYYLMSAAVAAVALFLPTSSSSSS